VNIFAEAVGAEYLILGAGDVGRSDPGFTAGDTCSSASR